MSTGKADAEALRKAMKGFGTDEKALIEIMGSRTSAQIQAIRKAYTDELKRDLIKDFKDECKGDFEDTLVALAVDPAESDALLIYNACKGVGTKEEIIAEVLCTRTPVEIKACLKAFNNIYKKDMIAVIEDETSGDLQKLFVCLMQHERPDDPKRNLDADVKAIYDAGQNKIGTNEGVFIRTLAENSRKWCEQIYFKYADKHGKALDAVIRSEMKGSLGESLAMLVTPLDVLFSTKLHNAMKGAGTDDATLIRIIVTQRERALKPVAKRFLADQKKTLKAAVAEECSGDYKKLLDKILDTFAKI